MNWFQISSHEQRAWGDSVLKSGVNSQKKKSDCINIDRIAPHHVHEINYL